MSASEDGGDEGLEQTKRPDTAQGAESEDADPGAADSEGIALEGVDPNGVDPESGGDAGGSVDPTRRASLLLAGILVPVVAALLVAVRLIGSPGEGPDESGAALSSTGRSDAVVDVETPAVTPEADAVCPTLMEALPLELVGEPSRRVSSDSPFAYAWGDPATVLVCGVEQPTYPPDAVLIYLNGITWFVDTSDPTTVVWTTVDRTVAVQLSIPARTDGAAATALGPTIGSTVPPR